MKYCTKCGAKMNDDAIFCSKCGAKFDDVVGPSNYQTAEEGPAVNQEPPKPAVNQEPPKPAESAKAKEPRAPLYEQKVRAFLPVPLALIGCSIVIWIIDSVGNTSGITRILPLIIFMLLSAFLAVMSMIRAVKTLNRKIYFKSALSFVLFALLVTCLIIDFVFLINS